MKSISKGEYKRFLPAENYITIQKIKYGRSNVIGAERGYVLEIDEKNLFINDELAQSILLKMQGFTFIPYTYQTTESDFAIDVGDMFDISNTNNVKYQTFVMGNSWEFTGAVSQTWTAKGENELNNSYTSKGPISKQLENTAQQIESIVKEQIPNAKQEAIDKATELLTDFNGGYVVKKDGELFISDNEDIDKAQHLWRWNINGLGYSSHGIDGPYGLAITMDGKIVADFITAGTMSAERINGGTLKLGGNNNTNGSIQVVDANGKSLVNISKDGLVLSNGTKLIGNGGVLSNLSFSAMDWKDIGYSICVPYMPDYEVINVNAFIPNNFIVVSAYLVAQFLPVNWGYGIEKQLGYCRDINLYYQKLNSGSINPVNIQLASEYYDYEHKWLNNNTNAFVHSGSPNSLVTYVSGNLSGFLEKGKGTSFQLRTSKGIDTFSANSEWDMGVYDKNRAARTGYGRAMLNVYGYLQ